MQKFVVDVNRPAAPMVLWAKQQDAQSRRVQLVLMDGGVPFVPPETATASAWYETPAGTGNYTEGVTVTGNTVEVMLAEQMLGIAGEGTLGVELHDAGPVKFGLWNITVKIEAVPGIGSAAAQDYFTAFDENVQGAIQAQTKAEDAATRAETAANKSDWIKQLGGSTIAKGGIVTANLTENTPLHCITEFAPTGGGGTPEKPIPVVGTDKLDVTVCGSNLINPSAIKVGNGRIDIYQKSTTPNFAGFPLKAGVKYTLSFSNPAEEIVIISEPVLSDAPIIRKQNTKRIVFTPSKDYKCRFLIRNTDISAIKDIKMGIGDENPYTPYTGNTYTVNFNGTQYGGSYDWNTGVFEVGWVEQKLDGKERWLLAGLTSSGKQRMYLENFPSPAPLNDGVKTDCLLCDTYKTVSTNQTYYGETGVSVDENSNLICYFGESIQTVEALKVYLENKNNSGNPVILVYKPKELKTIQLAPQQPISVNGTNNIFGNVGTVSVSRDNHPVAPDSEKLGGKLPNELGINMDLLWENPNPTAEFAEQRVEILDNHPIIILVCRTIQGVDQYISFVFPMKGRYAPTDFLSTGRIYRSAIYASGYIDFSKGESDGSVTNNKVLVPIKIFGIK